MSNYFGLNLIECKYNFYFDYQTYSLEHTFSNDLNTMKCSSKCHHNIDHLIY